MPLLRRRERPPAEILEQLEPDERFVTWADAVDGAVVVVTSHGLWWPFREGVRRIPWPHIDKVTWRDGVIAVVEADVVDDLLVDRAPVVTRLSVPRDLPPVVRKRVEANVVRSEVLAVGGGSVRFVARRLPGRDGLAWWARIEPGTPDTTRLRSAISARLTLLRRESDEQQ